MSGGLTRRELLRSAGTVAGVGAVASALPAVARRSIAAAATTSRSRVATTTYSVPEFAPPAVLVQTAEQPGAADGLILTTCHGVGQQAVMILDGLGNLVWYHPVSENGTWKLRAMNLRMQTYHGKPVLTWWEGEAVSGHGNGSYVIVDTSYRTVARVTAHNGLSGDLHEFVLTDRGTALFTAYGTATADLSPYGGSTHGTYLYCEAQEVDVATGELLMTWRIDDHIGLDESYEAVPTSSSRPWHAFHMNSINVDPADGNLVISARNCWAAYKVHRTTGEVLWRFGGKRSDFPIDSAARFAYQHHVTVLPGGLLTLFDNGGIPWVRSPSRALAFAIDETAKTAALLKDFRHDPAVKSGALGSMQVLPGGHSFIGWGTSTWFSEVTPDGRVLLDARLDGPKGLRSYRAFKQQWAGRPLTAPALVVSRTGSRTTAYASWNGATDLARWRIFAGKSRSALTPIATVDSTGFETPIAVPGQPAFVRVEALDVEHMVTGVSPVVALATS